MDQQQVPTLTTEELDRLFTKGFRAQYRFFALQALVAATEFTAPRVLCEEAFAASPYANSPEVIDRLCDVVSAQLGELFRSGLKLGGKSYIVMRVDKYVSRTPHKCTSYAYKAELIEEDNDRKLDFNLSLVHTMNVEECLQLLDLVHRRLKQLNTSLKETR